MIHSCGPQPLCQTPMPHQKPHLLIGVSARIYYPGAPVLDLGGVWTKTLHYLEQSVAQWLLRGGALPVMVPAFEAKSLVQRESLNLHHYVEALDGLVLQGGNDVSPLSYNEAALRPEWEGDAIRDRYEMELIKAFVAAGKPVFGICRGLQLLNVAFGGTLYQDIPTQRPQSLPHLRLEAYERNFHAVQLQAGGWLDSLYPHQTDFQINSIHHQGIKDLAPGFFVEARCPDDGMVESISRRGGSFIAGVQWHPEFHPVGTPDVFDDAPMLRSFLQACRATQG